MKQSEVKSRGTVPFKFTDISAELKLQVELFRVIQRFEKVIGPPNRKLFNLYNI
jgi:hypothetical protein